MTIAADAGQLLWIGFHGLELRGELAGRIRRSEVGAVVLFRRNIESIDQLLALNRALHEADPRLLVCVDQEGGRVQRVRSPGTVWPPMLQLAERPDGAELAESVGRALGDELAVLGFDVDFAPVLDVHTNPQNPVIGDRAFTTTPERVALLGAAFARGLEAAGVLPCAKHFPGHGDTSVDSHLALPRVDHSLERLRQVELYPFAKVHLPLLMTAHVVFAALDADVPATLSRRVLHELLRGELGYDGVVVSDDLDMKAIVDHFGVADAVVRGLGAGCDTFLLCEREQPQHLALEALVHAAESSSEVRARLSEAAARVAALKARHFGRPRPEVSEERARLVLGSAAHRALAERMA